MKKIILFIAFGSWAISTSAQEMKGIDVPASITSAFAKMYPNARVDKWEKEMNNYEAEFRENKTDMSVSFGPNGQLIQTEQEIEITALPQGVTDYVSKNLKGKKIKEASKITDASGHVSYSAEVNGEDYIFDSDCNYLKKEQEVTDAD
jgi:hypothetical protein